MSLHQGDEVPQNFCSNCGALGVFAGMFCPPCATAVTRLLGFDAPAETRDCEYCGDQHDHCDQCGQPTVLETCPACCSWTCEMEAMERGDAREAEGLPRTDIPR